MISDEVLALVEENKKLRAELNALVAWRDAVPVGSIQLVSSTSSYVETGKLILRWLDKLNGVRS